MYLPGFRRDIKADFQPLPNCPPPPPDLAGAGGRLVQLRSAADADADADADAGGSEEPFPLPVREAPLQSLSVSKLHLCLGHKGARPSLVSPCVCFLLRARETFPSKDAEHYGIKR